MVTLTICACKTDTKNNNWDSCWICRCKDMIEMHHVKHLRNHINPKQTGCTKFMSGLNRKQIPVCQAGHLKIHKGTYNVLALKNLKRPG